jgi:hypothetical protein
MYSIIVSIYVPSSWTLISYGVVAFGIGSYHQRHPYHQTILDLPVVAFHHVHPLNKTDTTISPYHLSRRKHHETQTYLISLSSGHDIPHSLVLLLLYILNSNEIAEIIKILINNNMLVFRI